MVDIEAGQISIIDEVPGAGRVALGPRGNILGLDEGDTLWSYEPAEDKLKPEGSSLVPLALEVGDNNAALSKTIVGIQDIIDRLEL